MMMDFLSEEAAVGTVEAWIEKLFECKPLTEGEVKQLCEKVRRMQGREGGRHAGWVVVCRMGCRRTRRQGTWTGLTPSLLLSEETKAARLHSVSLAFQISWHLTFLLALPPSFLLHPPPPRPRRC